MGTANRTSQSGTKTGRGKALAGLGLALFLGLAPFTYRLIPGGALSAYVAREGLWWAAAISLLVWLTQVERLPVASIGLRRTGWRGVAIGVAAGLALVAIQIAHFTLLVPALGLDPAAAVDKRTAIVKLPLWFRLALVVRAALVEEIVYRGYPIEAVGRLTGRRWAGGIVSVAVFTYAHLSGWGAVHLIPVAASGALLAFLYVRRRDLVSNIIGHFLVDAAGFLA